MGSVSNSKSGFSATVTWSTGPTADITISSNSYSYAWRLKEVSSGSIIIQDTRSTSESFYASNNTRYELQAYSPSSGWIEIIDWTLVFDSEKTLTLNKNGYSWSSFPSGGSYWPGDTVYISNPGTPPKTNGTASTFTITGNANGGTSNTSLTASKTPVTSYSFKEWNSNSGGTGTKYVSGFSMPNSNLTLYAIANTSTTYSYSNNSLSSLPKPTNNTTQSGTALTVSLDANGGNISDLTPRTSSTTIGYSFDKWTSDKAGNTTAATSFTAAATVYAQWKQTVTHSSVSLPSTGTKQGYKFVGWALQGSEVIYNNTYTPDSNVTLYAQWEPDSNTPYSVNYYTQDINTDTFTLHNSETKYGYTNNTVNVNDIVSNITGFTYKEAKSNGAIVSSITISADGLSSVDLYYTRNTYSVTLNKGENVLSVSGSGTYQYGENVIISADYEDIYHLTS